MPIMAAVADNPHLLYCPLQLWVVNLATSLSLGLIIGILMGGGARLEPTMLSFVALHISFAFRYRRDRHLWSVLMAKAVRGPCGRFGLCGAGGAPTTLIVQPRRARSALGRGRNGRLPVHRFEHVSNIPLAGMTSLLKDPTLAPPIVLDAMHRIDAAVAAAQTGAMIIVDEAPFLLRNAAFRERLLERLRRDRKRRIAVGLLVQGAGDLDQISSDLGTDVRKLTATWIFLPNPKADPEEGQAVGSDRPRNAVPPPPAAQHGAYALSGADQEEAAR